MRLPFRTSRAGVPAPSSERVVVAVIGIGKTLRSAREAQGKTLQMVSGSTRIREDRLAAIEEERFEGLGGDAYVRGFIRSYAVYLGLDPAPLLEQHSSVAAQVPSPLQILEHPVALARRGVRFSWTAAGVLAALVLLSVSLVSLLQSPNKPSSNSALHPALAPQTSSASAGPAVVAQLPPVDAQEAGVEVGVAILGTRCWVQIEVDGQKAFEGMLLQGQSRSWHGLSAVRVILGDAGAVHLSVNGKNLGIPGDAGQVYKRVFGPGDPTVQG